MKTLRTIKNMRTLGTLLSFLVLSLYPGGTSAQSRDTLYMHTSAGQPHIITVTPRVKTSGLAGLSENQMRREIQYYDRFGNPNLNILHGLSPGGEDLVNLQTYDGLNRESFRYLPVGANTSGGGYMEPYVVGDIARAAGYYGKDSAPWSHPVYENSPLNRIRQQFGPGKDWEEHPVQTSFLTNQNRQGLAHYLTFYPKLSVRIYCLSADSLTYRQDYATGTLDCTQTTDEDGQITLEFKDRATDRVLLSRVMDGEVMHDTYYVYDDYGNLRMVLPPAASDLLTATTTPASWTGTVEAIQKYAYVYKYDGRNRCIYRKLPGCDPVYTVYDAADRPVFVQDGGQRAKGEWSFSIPDAFGRIVLTGTCRNTLDYTNDPFKNIVVKAIRLTGGNQTNELKGYTLSSQVTLTTPVVLGVNYYDRYSFIGSNGIPSGASTAYEKVAGYDELRTVGVKGLLTGTLTATLNSSGAVSGYLYSVLYYDERGRLIQQRGNNSLGGEDKIFTAYDFPGNPTQIRKVHTVGADTRTEVYTHTYDQGERLLRTTYQLDNDAVVTLVDNTYDEVGRLKSDGRNGNAKLKTEYAYNIRSWTKSITGTLFSQTLNYQEAITGNTPCYNGNISSMSWQSGVETSQRGYRFTYDGLSRLKDALYGEGATLAANTDRFNEQITAYDKMGNILGLKRYGQTAAGSYGMIDHLTLTYNGNRLQAVRDACTNSVYGNGTEFKDNSSQMVEYTYDKNGNLIKDLNKNISNIGYNCLNLPSQITLAGSTGSNSIDYEYGADGTKLRTVHKTGATTLTTDYCGNAVYENGVLKMLLNDAGYVSFPDRKFHFYLKDHQGNVRVVADKDGNVEETNAYYPFGGTFTSTNSVQPYKYNGKELDTRNGLNWYDYGARHYDAAIGRWHVVDPMSEKNSFMSPYVYSVNNSVNYIDPMGCDTVPDDEIWDYNLLNFRTNGMGLLAEEFIPVKIKGGVKYILREFVSGENKGNYAAIELYGKDPETGFDLYEYKYVVGENKVKDFKNGDTSPTGFQYNVVRWAADNGVNGNENVYQNMFRGYLQIVKDPMNWIPTPLDPTNLIPKSWYTISSPWNRFQMLNRGKYTIENYGTHQNALKNRSLDYQKWKQ